MENTETGVSSVAAGVGESAGTVNINTATTTQLKTGRGKLLGFYINSTTAGTIQFVDATSGSTPVLGGTITPAIGFHRYPIDFNTGLRVITAGTIDVTVFYR